MAPLILHLIFLLAAAAAPPITAAKTPVFFASVAAPNPFTAKASILRYWSRKLPSSPSRPSFLLSKFSPLSALDSSTYTFLAASGNLPALSRRLPAFCSAARLLCSSSPSSSLSSHPSPSNFATYQDSNFSNYASSAAGGRDSFKNYSGDLNIPIDSFRRYSRNSAGHDDTFSSYSLNANVATDNFTSYASSATGGSGSFSAYQSSANVPNLEFTNYAAAANGRQQKFTTYTSDTNSGDESFSSYGKNGNGVPTTFTSYADNSNVIGSGFSNYAENANGAADSFAAYGGNGNVPENTFKTYGQNGNAGSDTFASYRNQSNVGDDTFVSYAKSGSSSTAAFAAYGESFNPGSDTFKGYAEGGASNPNISFKTYSGEISNFKSYSKSGTLTFKSYRNASGVPGGAAADADADADSGGEMMMMMMTSAKKGKNRWVEPGKFFRESDLRRGNVMPMPDVSDRMPARAFLPRSIAGKIPFAAAEVWSAFGITPDSAMGKAVAETVAECRRAPSKGETKRCATSAEDVIDFAAAAIGGGAVARSMDTARGAGERVLLGDVKGVDGGKVTRAVSCHQSLFPYLVYYCHSVPKVRVYEAEIMAVDSKEVINHGVAICHLDTSDWSSGHGAFVALGSVPGKIEVCHWIFEGDMTWTV